MSYPNFELLDNVLLDSIIIGIVAYAVNVSVAKAFSKKNNYKIDPNQVRYAGVKVVSWSAEFRGFTFFALQNSM